MVYEGSLEIEASLFFYLLAVMCDWAKNLTAF